MEISWVGTAKNGKGSISCALLWNLQSGVSQDLNPDGYVLSYISNIFGNYAVGTGVDAAGGSHALLWFLGNGSVFDLNTVLPPGFVGGWGNAVTLNGNNIEVLGYATLASGGQDAILWSEPAPTPEPGSYLAIALFVGGALVARAGRSHTGCRTATPMGSRG